MCMGIICLIGRKRRNSNFDWLANQTRIIATKKIDKYVVLLLLDDLF